MSAFIQNMIYRNKKTEPQQILKFKNNKNKNNCNQKLNMNKM